MKYFASLPHFFQIENMLHNVKEVFTEHYKMYDKVRDLMSHQLESKANIKYSVLLSVFSFRNLDTFLSSINCKHFGHYTRDL